MLRILFASALLASTAMAVTHDDPFDDKIKEDDKETWLACQHFGGVDSTGVSGLCCAPECEGHCGTESCLEGKQKRPPLPPSSRAHRLSTPPFPRYLFLRRRSAPCFRQRQRGRLVLHRKPHQAGDVREDGARSRGGRGRPMRPAPGVLEARRGAVIKRRMPHASTTYLTADRPAPRLARFVTLQYMFLGAGSGNTLYVFLLHQSAWQSQQCAAAQTLPLHKISH